ncbi:hypothetical protein D9M69_643370 [compost metagenome]
MQTIVPTFLIIAIALQAPHLDKRSAAAFSWVCLLAAVIFAIIEQVIRRSA